MDILIRSRMDTWTRPLRAGNVFCTSIVWLVLLIQTASATETDPRILSIEPARMESLLVCFIQTEGMPGVPSLETLESGLPSALLVSIRYLDSAGRESTARETEIRLEPDLWEETYGIVTPWRRRHFPSLSQLATALGRIGPFPVARWQDVEPRSLLRIRAQLTILPVAPAERQRVRRSLWDPEDEALESRGQTDRRERSIGLHRVLEFFLRRDDVREGTTEATSAPFAPARLPRAES